MVLHHCTLPMYQLMTIRNRDGGHRYSCETLVVTLSSGDKEALERLAEKHYCYWGDRPNISQLFRLIAQQEIKLDDPELPKLVQLDKFEGDYE